MAGTIVTLKKGEGRTIKAGGAWIYDNEIDTILGRFKNGDICEIHDFDGYPMGRGFINQNSKIRIRMLSRNKDQEINYEFIYMRVKSAWEYRKSVMQCTNPKDVENIGNTEITDLNCTRLVFGEADFLPGLVVDKYSDVLVCECLCLGMDRLKRVVLSCLLDILNKDDIEVSAVYERSDAVVRKKEGMEPFKGLLPLAWIKESCSDNFEECTSASFNAKEIEKYVSKEESERVCNPVEIVENGIHYLVDVINGQKTGFFLDQKYNRYAIQKICGNLVKSKGSIRVLDCFTHMGTFALNCAYAGADDVTAVDISEFALKQAKDNARINGLGDRMKFVAANVLEHLPKLYQNGERYDLLILDPPAFTKSREATKNAIKGYRDINMKALRLICDGGYFATCSCSHFMTQELLCEVIKQAAKATHKRLRQIEFRTQASDHPILWAADESFYLKFLIFQVAEEK